MGHARRHVLRTRETQLPPANRRPYAKEHPPLAVTYAPRPNTRKREIIQNAGRDCPQNLREKLEFNNVIKINAEKMRSDI